MTGGLAPGQCLADAADGLGRHPEIRREHGLRHAQRDGRIDAQKLAITLLRGTAQRADDALILGGGMPLQAGAERRCVPRHPVDQSLMRGPIQEQEIGFFDGVDEVRRRSALVPAGRVGQPPRLGSELNDVLFSLGSMT